VKHVPTACVEGYVEGCWRNVVRWRPASAVAASSGRSSPAAAAAAAKGKTNTGDGGGDDEWTTLIDLTPLRVVPKRMRPISKQLPTESGRLWDSVTSRLLCKEFGEATRAKHIIEQRQRDEAAERKRRGLEYVDHFFFSLCHIHSYPLWEYAD